MAVTYDSEAGLAGALRGAAAAQGGRDGQASPGASA